MARYDVGSLTHPDNLSQQELIQYLTQELTKISAVFRLVDEGRQNVLSVAPSKPRQGQVVYADGVGWNPGAGEGLYRYNGTAWKRYSELGGDTFTGPVTIPGLTVTGLLDLSGASAGQIKFPAMQNPSANANTLDDYEEGTWTPFDASGASLTFTSPAGNYTKIGNVVVTRFAVTYPTTADGSSAVIGGLPFTVNGAATGTIFSQDTVGATTCKALSGGTTAGIFGLKGVAITNANLSTKIIQAGFTYLT